MEELANKDLAILKEAVANDIINIEDVQRVLNMKKEEDYLSLHQYEIYQGNDGKWYTYLPDKTKAQGRRKLKRTSESALKQAVIDFYKLQEKSSRKKSITLRGLYPEWIEWKGAHTRATTSIRRFNCDWKKFYLPYPQLIDKPIVDLTVNELDIWAHKLIKQYDMTKTCYYTMTILIRQMLDYAVDPLGIITENPFRKINLQKKMLRHPAKKHDETQVFLLEETPKVIEAALADFNRNPLNTAPLTVVLGFMTGLRLSEMAAIKENDVVGNILTISRMEEEVYDYSDLEHIRLVERAVIESTKTEAGIREVPLVPQALKVIDAIKTSNQMNGWYDDGFLFLNKGMRTTTRTIKYRIGKYCKECEIMEKSFHKVRKTYISALIDSGININEIRKAVGHTDERTTFSNYCYNRMGKAETVMQFEHALISENGMADCQISL
ncbi:MAG: tyrosine recombinase XerC [Monoglobales bacterium]